MFFILRRIQRDIVPNVESLHEKYPLFLSDFNETLTFSTHFLNERKYYILPKFFQWEPNCSMWTEGRTGITKLVGSFRNFANAPKKAREDKNLQLTKNV